jgi:hypothetical protein
MQLTINLVKPSLISDKCSATYSKCATAAASKGSDLPGDAILPFGLMKVVSVSFTDFVAFVGRVRKRFS